LPFERDFIFDLAFGRVYLLFLIDIEKFMPFADEFGLSARWATRREKGQIIDSVKKNGIFQFQKKGIIPKPSMIGSQLSKRLGIHQVYWYPRGIR
jgi:hypothetical protein